MELVACGKLMFSLATMRSIIRAEEYGLFWIIETSMFSITLSRIEMVKARWNEIASILLDTLAGHPGVRIKPKRSGLFNRRVSKMDVFRVMKKFVFDDGSIIFLFNSEERARSFHEACNRYL